MVLGLGGGVEGEGEADFVGDGGGDAAVFGGVFGAEPAVVLAGDHVGGVGFEDAGVGAGLGEDFADEIEIVTEGGGEAKALGEAGGVDVHDHVDEGFDFGGGAGATDEAAVDGHVFEDGEEALVDGLVAGEHEVEFAFAGVADAGGHAGLEGVGPGGFGGGVDFAMDGGGDGGAVDEGFAGGAGEEVVGGVEEDAAHGGVIGDDGEDEVGGGGDFSEGGGGGAMEFGGEGLGERGVVVVDGGDGVTGVFEVAGHVGAHAADADECDGGRGHRDCGMRIGDCGLMNGLAQSIHG